ncbi:MAG: Holliday junction resolvase RuvX [Pseudonocardiales bacterium]|nr:Holliday junction resolvase RuvX [Pseudonocardiales bacterium]
MTPSYAGPDARPDPGPGRRLGVDFGEVRIGVALSDPSGVLATPLVTLHRDRSSGADLDALVALVTEHEVVEVVVGLPRTLAGRHGPAAQAATDYARTLAKRLGHRVPVRLTDERLTTVSVTRVLAERGVRGRKQRAVIDQAAAVEILQGWLEARRAAR